MGSKQCHLLRVARVRRHSLWLCRKRVPTSTSVSDAVLGTVHSGGLPVSDFPFLCSSASGEPRAKILYKFPAEAKMHSAWASSCTNGSWAERKGSWQRELCPVGGNGTLWHSLSQICGHRCFHRCFNNTHSLTYLKDRGAKERAQIVMACLQTQGPEFDPQDWCNQKPGVVMYT